MEIYKIEFEYDIGQDNLVFSSIKKAEEWLLNNENFTEEFKTIKAAKKSGVLFNFTKLKLIK